MPIQHDSWEFSARFLHYHVRAVKEQPCKGLANWGHEPQFDEVFQLWGLHLGIGGPFSLSLLGNLLQSHPYPLLGPFLCDDPPQALDQLQKGTTVDEG